MVPPIIKEKPLHVYFFFLQILPDIYYYLPISCVTRRRKGRSYILQMIIKKKLVKNMTIRPTVGIIQGQ